MIRFKRLLLIAFGFLEVIFKQYCYYCIEVILRPNTASDDKL